MIVCCGEALIDFLPRKTEGGADSYQPFVGGSVLNVAVAIGRLGVPAGFFCGLSEDFFGAMIRDALKASNVDISLCPIRGRPTTLAFVKLTDGNAEYAFSTRARRCAFSRRRPAGDSATVTAMHFGSIGLTAEPCGSAYRR
jgi:fructokinase